jgi:hypothetical protein
VPSFSIVDVIQVRILHTPTPPCKKTFVDCFYLTYIQILSDPIWRQQGSYALLDLVRPSSEDEHAMAKTRKTRYHGQLMMMMMMMFGLWAMAPLRQRPPAVVSSGGNHCRQIQPISAAIWLEDGVCFYSTFRVWMIPTDLLSHMSGRRWEDKPTEAEHTSGHRPHASPGHPPYPGSVYALLSVVVGTMDATL